MESSAITSLSRFWNEEFLLRGLYAFNLTFASGVPIPIVILIALFSH